MRESGQLKDAALIRKAIVESMGACPKSRAQIAIDRALLDIEELIAIANALLDIEEQIAIAKSFGALTTKRGCVERIREITDQLLLRLGGDL
jgi:hypothetical protein